MKALEFTTGLAIGFGVIVIVELFVIIHWINKHERLWKQLSRLRTRVSDAEWREEAASVKIKQLEALLQSQVQKALAPEAEELASWIEETEQELTKDES